MKRHLLALVACALVAGCGGTAPQTADPHVAALQYALDQPDQHTTMNVPLSGTNVCWDTEYFNQKFGPYEKIGVASRPVKKDAFSECTTFHWPKSAGIVPAFIGGRIDVGRYVVDKIGGQQDGPLNTKFFPYNAHFEPTEWGRKLIAVGLIDMPSVKTDAAVYFHTDADGKLVGAL